MELGQIVYCNLHLKTKNNKKVVLKETVFSYDYEKKRTKLYWSVLDDKRLIKRTGFEEDLIIEKIDVIKELGYKNKSKEYTLAKANKLSKRDKMGGYE